MAAPQPRAGSGMQRLPNTRPQQRNIAAKIAGGFGEFLLTTGAVVLLFVVYTLWGTGIETAAAQDDLRDELSFDGGRVEKEQEPTGLDQLELGDAYGIIRVPRFGDDWEWVIVEGTEPEDLNNGPGHYAETVDPGEVGNFSVAAHRSGHGQPFARFPELHVGDTVEIETSTGIFSYELDDAPDGNPKGNMIDIDERWVVDPVPGEPRGTEPTERRITLTTCYPRWGSSHRMYATGTLVGGEVF